MGQSSSHTACLTLERSWNRKDVAGCATLLGEILSGVDATPGESAALKSVAQTLRSMRPSDAASQDTRQAARFAALRSDLLQRAGALDTGLRLAIEAEEVATLPRSEDWPRALLRYVLSRGAGIGHVREGIWEDAVFIHWGIGQLATLCNLAEPALLGLFQTLVHVERQLTWESAGPVMLREIMRQESKRLQAVLAAKVVSLAETTDLTAVASLIPHDTDGAMLSVLGAESLKQPPNAPNTAALLFFLTQRGVITPADFIARVSHLPFFIISEDRFTLAAGETVPFPVCRVPALQDDGRERRFHLSWWLNVDFPREQLGHPQHLAARLPYFVRHLLRENAATLVLSGSGEASWFSVEWLNHMVALADALEISPAQIVYLPQNIRFAAQSQAARRTRHPGSGTQVVPFNHHLIYTGWRAEPKQARPRKRFLCFNQKAHIHRAALMLLMQSDGLLPESHFSFNQTFDPANRVDGAVLAPWMEMPPSDIDALIAAIAPRLPLRLDLAGTGLADVVDGDYVSSYSAELFADAAVYLVSETEMETGAMCRFTEKTVKGLAAEIPFLLFGSQGALKSLRDLGFRTFAPFIDESYDAVLDPAARFRAAYAEVRRLAAMPLDGLIAMRQTLHPVLAHNRRHLLAIGPVLHDALAPSFAAPASAREPLAAAS